nr:hypothetical protein [Tanacetum cinerariifolium]
MFFDQPRPPDKIEVTTDLINSVVDRSSELCCNRSSRIDHPNKLVEIVLFIFDSGCSKHMTGNLKLLINFVEKFLGTGNDLLTGSRCTDLYSIKLQDTNSPNPICLMAKASSSQAWLWHRHLSHLNFDTINLLSKNDIVVGLPKLKFIKDHLCSSSSINGKRYVLVIVDDYSRYTWTHFLSSKDETPEVLIDFLRLVQRGLQAQVRVIQTDKGTKILNQTLHTYFAAEGIRYQTSVARTLEQNDVVERQNRTLVEAARTMLSAAKIPLFFWAEAIATACFTQNRSLVIPRHEKTPNHIINDRKPSVKFFYIFGSTCFIVRDGENLDKMKEKDIHGKRLGNGFSPHWIGDNTPNNQNGWIEEDMKEEEEDPEEDSEEDLGEDPKGNDDDDMEMDDEAEVIDPYMDDGSNNPPPPNSEDKETPLTSPVIPDADGQPIPPIASFGQNIHFGESSSTTNLLTGNSKIVPTGPMCPNLGTAWKRLGKMEKLVSERIDTKGRVQKKFKEQDCYFVGLGCDNIKMDRTVRNVMSDLSGLKKLVKGLSDRFDEYERSKVFEAKRSKGSFPLPIGSQVREPPAEPSARPVPAPYPNGPYVVTRDAAIAAAVVANFGINDDDDDIAPMDS